MPYVPGSMWRGRGWLDEADMGDRRGGAPKWLDTATTAASKSQESPFCR